MKAVGRDYVPFWKASRLGGCTRRADGAEAVAGAVEKTGPMLPIVDYSMPYDRRRSCRRIRQHQLATELLMFHDARLKFAAVQAFQAGARAIC